MNPKINSLIVPQSSLWLFMLICIIALSAPTFGQDFYDIDNIETIELIFVEPNWDEILDSLRLAGDEERLIGTAIVNGIQFDSVGVRYKGNSSYSPSRVKNPWNIKLDHVIEDQTYQGYGTLKLANCFKDPSFVREAATYEIARRYMAASLSNFANVYVNGDLIGLYSNVQSVDKFFLQNHFSNEENPFFKGELEGMSATVWGYFGPDSSTYMNYYEMRSDYGWEELIDFLYAFNNNPPDMEDILDVDRHLWMLAFDILMVNLDAPVNFAHNFYLTQDIAGQFIPIMWDLNENFGGFTSLIGGTPLSIYQMQQLDPFLNSTNPNYPIITEVLNDPLYRKIYIAHMKTLIEENFNDDQYLDRILEIQDIIDADVQADPNKLYTYSDFINNVYNQVGFGPGGIVGIVQLMDARTNYINNHSSFQGDPPVISDVSHSPTVVNPNTVVWFNATVTNATDVQLGYREAFTDRFQKTEMFDDGNHNDGQAGDGIYGVSLESGSVDIEYYIFAENSEAVSFSPVRAEYEFYTISLTGDLVVNEFLADNETIITDPQGEYEDWIELYNASDQSIDLLGMYLTDDLSRPDKWAFPDTSIDAQDYLLLWCDEDEEDPGLHTNFKLSNDGEEIGLYRDENGTMVQVDIITFGPQADDISYGRYPDGGENWMEMTPTPESANTAAGFPNMLIELTYVSGSPVPSGGGNVYFDVYVENADSVALDYDAWLEVAYAGGTPTTVVQRSFTSYQPGWTINRPNSWFPVPGTYAAGNYTLTGKVGQHPDLAWAVSGFDFVKSGVAVGDDYVPVVPSGVPDPFEDVITGDEPDAQLPTAFGLLGAYPNPFNPQTTIRFTLPEAAPVQICIFNVQGQQVATLVNGTLQPGIQEVVFDAAGLPSGLYFYHLQAGDVNLTRKLVLMK